MRWAVVDLDNCLLDWIGGFCEFHNESYGSRITPAGIWDYDVSKVLGISHEEMNHRVVMFDTSPKFLEIKPYAGAVEAVAELGRYFRLAAVTGRADHLRQSTPDQVRCHFPAIEEIIYAFGGGSSVKHKDDVPSKAEVCRQLSASWMYEDSLEHAIPCAAVVPKVFLQCHAWNNRPKKQLPANVWRVYEPLEIVKAVVHEHCI